MEIEMITSTQIASKGMNAGLYLRVKMHIQSLGWSWSKKKKKSTDLAEVETEHPWAGLAEWLRAAHSLLDEQTGELSRNSDRASQVCAIE
jgi:hypothetical protein